MILSTFLLLSSASALVPDEPFAAHPADAAISFQIPSIGALLEAYESSVYGRILADQALHEAIGRILGAGGPVDPRELLAQQWSQQVAQGAPPVDRFVDALSAFSFSLSVPGGDLAGFLTSMEASQDQEALAASQVTLRAILDFKDAEGAAMALDAVRQAIQQGGPELQVEELPSVGGAFGAATMTRLNMPAGPSAFGDTARLIAGGTRIALLAGAESDEVALGRMVAPAGGPSAATVFRAARQGFDAPTGAVVFEAHINPFVERIVMAEEPMALAVLDVVEGLLGPLGSMAIRGGDWRVRLEGGQFVTEGNYPKPAASPLAGLFGAKALDPEDLALVMPDAIVAGAVSMDKDVLQRLFAGVIAQQGGEDMLVELDNSFGFRPDRDLIAPLGDAIAYSLPPLTTLLSAPPFTVSFDIADLDAFTKGMDGVFTLLEAQGTDAVQLKREEYKGSRLYTLSFAGANDAGGGIAGLPINPAAIFRPTMAIGQGRAFLITTPNLAKKEIRRVDKLKGALELHPALSGAALPKGATEVGYADWADFFGRIYSGVKGLAPMLGAVVGQLPFDLSMLPEGELITQHFQPSFRSKRIDGNVVRVHGRSSFGPELSLVASLGAAASMRQAVAVQAYEGSFDDFDEGVAPTEATEATEEVMVVEEEPYTGPDAALLLTQDLLLTIKVDLTVHRFDKGAYPASLGEFGHAGAVDGWGHAVVYKLTQANYSLYSVGPNGVDDGGAGDDILPLD
ncbi:MAG: hypothetical protein R3F49_18510 [Planctomycetota bacterium]